MSEQTITLAQIKAALRRLFIKADDAREDELAQLLYDAYRLVTRADTILNGEDERVD